MEPQRLEPLDGRCGRSSDRVGDGHGSDNDVVAPDENGGATRSTPTRRTGGQIVGYLPDQSANSSSLPDCDLMTVDRSPGTDARLGHEPVDGGQAAQLGFGGGGDGPATRCSDACSSAPAQRRSVARSTPGPPSTSVTAILPSVTVPVLSSTTVSTCREASSAW